MLGPVGLKKARCLLQVILLPECQAVKLFQGHAKNLLEVSGREVSLKRQGAKHFPCETDSFLQTMRDLKMDQSEP